MSEETQAPAIIENTSTQVGNIYSDKEAFELAQRIGKALANSSWIPERWRGKLADCIMAVDMARNMNVPAKVLLDNAYSVGGKVAFEGKFVIAVGNQARVYQDDIQFEFTGEGENLACTAWGVTPNGVRQEMTVSLKQAKSNGWFEKNPHWRNNTQLMLMYRAGAWLFRAYHPQVTLGLPLADEIIDVDGVEVLTGKKASIKDKIRGAE